MRMTIPELRLSLAPLGMLRPCRTSSPLSTRLMRLPDATAGLVLLSTSGSALGYSLCSSLDYLGCSS